MWQAVAEIHHKPYEVIQLVKCMPNQVLLEEEGWPNGPGSTEGRPMDWPEGPTHLAPLEFCNDIKAACARGKFSASLTDLIDSQPIRNIGHNDAQCAGSCLHRTQVVAFFAMPHNAHWTCILLRRGVASWLRQNPHAAALARRCRGFELQFGAAVGACSSGRLSTRRPCAFKLGCEVPKQNLLVVAATDKERARSVRQER